MKADRQRIDKWLWFARFARSRSLAARLVTDGFVRLNGTRVETAAKGIACGDVLTVAAPHATATLRVRDLGKRRGPAEEARSLYEDLSGQAVKEAGRTAPPVPETEGEPTPAASAAR